MTALAWLIPAALGLGFLGLMGFLWAVRSGQYEDMDGAARRILIDDDGPLTDDDRDQDAAGNEGSRDEAGDG
ncbi:MAG: cbb3-type cytochrome oxidase assembly protein CcoS [Maricaulaceae bacterium]|nr:cbb3-type cytochrome oxidase assembly protein CcoS [Maricaulaceae bacterium]